MKNYFKIAAYFVFVAVVMGISASTIFALSGGPADGRTGSPADSLKTCNDTGCHNSFTLNSGKATFSISAPDNYTLGEVVPITISFSNSTTAKHGFELSALDANDKHVGTFSSVDGKTQTSNGNYIKHTSAGSSQSGNASWNVNWTAPAIGQGVVTFYAAGNEANFDFTPQGDYIYTTTEQISAAAATPTATPTPTTSECEPDAITLDTKKPNLKLGESKTITVTVRGSDDCKPEGATVKAVIKTGKDRVTINLANDQTDENGQATFTITAGQKDGNAKIVFTVQDSAGKTYKTFVTAKVRKK
jgi:hypothetical protein